MQNLDRYTPYALAALRIAAALIFIEHGTQKLFGFPAPPDGGLPEAGSLLWIGAWLELLGGALLLFGAVQIGMLSWGLAKGDRLRPLDPFRVVVRHLGALF